MYYLNEKTNKLFKKNISNFLFSIKKNNLE